MRKEQNDFGWDWSPSFAPAGPWQSARVVQIPSNSPLYVRNALIDIYREGQQNNLPPDQSKPFVFNANIDFLGPLPNKASMSLKLRDSSGRMVFSGPLEGVYNNNETVTGSTSIPSSSVQLWWPNGMGNQMLYNATVTVEGTSGRTVATVNRRVGFRTIVLNITPISKE